MLFVVFACVVYVIVSVAIATATETRCNTVTGGNKAWVFAPPHWECRGQAIRIGS